MDWGYKNAEIELAWYFQTGIIACCTQSVQATFEATMEKFSKCRRKDGAIAVHETRFSSPNDRVTEYKLANWGRARTIRHALQKLTKEQRNVLELAFSYPPVFHGGCGVSIPLAASTKVACDKYATTIETLKKLDRKNRSKPGYVPQALPTISQWLSWVDGEAKASTQNFLTCVVEQAKGAKSSALRAFIQVVEVPSAESCESDR